MERPRHLLHCGDLTCNLPTNTHRTFPNQLHTAVDAQCLGLPGRVWVCEGHTWAEGPESQRRGLTRSRCGEGPAGDTHSSCILLTPLGSDPLVPPFQTKAKDPRHVKNAHEATVCRFLLLERGSRATKTRCGLSLNCQGRGFCLHCSCGRGRGGAPWGRGVLGQRGPAHCAGWSGQCPSVDTRLASDGLHEITCKNSNRSENKQLTSN